MSKEQIAEFLKEEIQTVEQSKKDENPNNKIVTVHLNAEIFLKMAYLYVGINGQ